MKLYNSLSRQKEEVTPLDNKTITIYTCGPTVYDFAHIGNLRTYIFEDILIRSLLHEGYVVKHVINITDIGHLVSDSDVGEDKMMKALQREGLDATPEAMMQLAAKYTQAFKDDIAKLHVFQIENENYSIEWAPATDYIQEMIDLTQTLLEKGNAYETDQAIYFDVSTFADYTKLSGQKLEDKLVGVRAEVETDTEKRHAADFALWFKLRGKHKAHVMHWASPWGEGFPGWHIECSAMAMKTLGKTIDIHCGGIDHVPVHHTNEIAQSEAATGKPFARMWVHGEFLDLNKAKMSKSAGSFITLQDVIDKGFNPLAYRYFVLSGHYRQKLHFSWEALEGAQHALDKLYHAVQRADVPGKIDAVTKDIFDASVSDDMNMPKALAALWEVLKSDTVSEADALATALYCDDVLSLGLHASYENSGVVPAEVQALVAEREIARKKKDFVTSDKLRDQINDRGWQVEDAVDGPKVYRV